MEISNMAFYEGMSPPAPKPLQQIEEEPHMDDKIVGKSALRTSHSRKSKTNHAFLKKMYHDGELESDPAFGLKQF
jgi:hypothetical protein